MYIWKYEDMLPGIHQMEYFHHSPKLRFEMDIKYKFYEFLLNDWVLLYSGVGV